MRKNNLFILSFQLFICICLFGFLALWAREVGVPLATVVSVLLTGAASVQVGGLADAWWRKDQAFLAPAFVPSMAFLIFSVCLADHLIPSARMIIDPADWHAAAGFAMLLVGMAYSQFVALKDTPRPLAFPIAIGWVVQGGTNLAVIVLYDSRLGIITATIVGAVAHVYMAFKPWLAADDAAEKKSSPPSAT